VAPDSGDTPEPPGERTERRARPRRGEGVGRRARPLGYQAVKGLEPGHEG